MRAALPADGRVSARRGWVGEKSGLFEHPADVRSSWVTHFIDLVDLIHLVGFPNQITRQAKETKQTIPLLRTILLM